MNTTSERTNDQNAPRSKQIGTPLRQRETAQYLSDMLLELRNLAKSAELYKVMVPLEYAYYEAFGAANRVDIPQEEVERLKELSRTSEGMDPSIPDPY